MQGPEGLSVGRIIHLDGSKLDDNWNVIGSACVAGIVTYAEGDILHVTAFNSPLTAANGSLPYDGSWHWPEGSANA